MKSMNPNLEPNGAGIYKEVGPRKDAPITRKGLKAEPLGTPDIPALTDIPDKDRYDADWWVEE